MPSRQEFMGISGAPRGRIGNNNEVKRVSQAKGIPMRASSQNAVPAVYRGVVTAEL